MDTEQQLQISIEVEDGGVGALKHELLSSEANRLEPSLSLNDIDGDIGGDKKH